MSTFKIPFAPDPDLLRIPRRYNDANIEDIHVTMYSAFAQNYVDKFDQFYSLGMGFGLFGNPGMGKTYTAAAIARALSSRKQFPVPVFWINTSYHFEHLLDLKEFRNSAYFRLVEKMFKSPLIILDDISSIQTNTRIKDKFNSLIQFRYAEKLPVIFTGNFQVQSTFDSWTQVTTSFGPAIGRRIYLMVKDFIAYDY